jgi:hypothetical protein
MTRSTSSCVVYWPESEKRVVARIQRCTAVWAHARKTRARRWGGARFESADSPMPLRGMMGAGLLCRFPFINASSQQGGCSRKLPPDLSLGGMGNPPASNLRSAAPRNEANLIAFTGSEWKQTKEILQCEKQVSNGGCGRRFGWGKHQRLGTTTTR